MMTGWSLHSGTRALTPALSQREREPIPAVPGALAYSRWGSQHQPHPPRSSFRWEGQYPLRSYLLRDDRHQAHICVLLPLEATIPTAPAFHPLPLGEGWGEGSRLT